MENHGMKHDIIITKNGEEQEMAQIRCVQCQDVKDVFLRSLHDDEILRGVILCPCGGKTSFELKGNVLSFIASKDFPISDPKHLPNDARERFSEAKLCYFGLALRATAVMLRATVESALKEKGIIKGKLEEKIDVALKQNIISQREYTLAHGTRLVGNESIHDATIITLAEIQGLFGAVAQIMDKIFP